MEQGAGWPEGPGDKIPILVRPPAEQRRDEILAIYARQRLGFRMVEFLREADIEHSTWWKWIQQDPSFASEVADIQDQRRRIVLEPLERELPDIVSAHAKAGRSGEGWAVRLAYEVLGLVKPANQSVRVNTVVSSTQASNVETTQEEIIADHERLRLHVLRLAERARAIEGDSGDSGPQGNGGGPAAEPGTGEGDPGTT